MPLDFGLILQPGWRAVEPPDILTFNEEAIQRVSPAFTALWTEDHFQKATNPALESWTTLAFMAARHERFRVGNLVLGQNYRNPAHVAKMAVTLQYLSRGRLILGLGAGWQEDEYAAYGYVFPSAGERVAQLAEAIHVIRAMWTQAPATYHGTRYHVDNAYCEPRPSPLPPIVVGGNGAKTIAIAARQADGWNSGAPIELFRERLALLQDRLREAGRDPNTYWTSLYLHLQLTKETTEFTSRQAELERLGVVLLGPSPSAALEQLRPYVELGVAHVAVKPYDLESIDRFSAEVVPALIG